MKPRSQLIVSPLVVALGLAACDGGNEAQVAALSEELSATQAELDAAMNENEQLRAELEQMGGEAPGDGAGDPAAGSAGGPTASGLGEAVENELEAMTEKLTVALANLSEIEAQTENGQLSEVRENLQEAVGSAQTLLTVIGGQQPAPDAGEAAPDTPAAPDEAPPEAMEEAPADPAQQ